MSASIDLQSAILSAIVQASLIEHDGAKVCHLEVAATLDALAMVSASLIASAPEAATSEGVKRILRRQARQLESRVTEFRRHAVQHGSPFQGASA